LLNGLSADDNAEMTGLARVKMQFKRTLHIVIAILITILAAFLVTPAAFALNPEKKLSQYRMDTWDSKDGLPRSVITAIAQTPDGYLWVGSGLGIVRFDGASFSVFNPGNSVGLTRAGIGTLRVSPAGDLWVGTDGSGFGTFTPGRYQRFATGPEDKEWSRTYALNWMRDGRLMVGMQHATLYNPRYAIREGRLVEREIMQGLVHGFAQDRAGAVWCISDGVGVVRIDSKRPSRTILTTANGLPSATLTSLCADTDGSIWIGTEGHGVCRYRNGVCTTFTTRDGLPSDEITCLYQDREGCLWVGTRAGVARWYRNRFTAFHTTGFHEENPVFAIFEDHEKNLWVGAKSGLIRFADTKLTPIAAHLENGRLLTLAGETVSPDGSIWAGTTDSGVVRLNPDGTFHSVLTTAQGLPADKIGGLCAGRDGTLWIALDHCLARYSHGILTKFPLQTSLRLLKVDAVGDLVAVDDKAVLRFHNGRITSRYAASNLWWMFDLEVDHNNTIWLGCGRGLARLANGKLDVVKGWPPEVPALCIAFDPDGNTVWAGTDRGLARYDRGRVVLYSTKDGLPNDNVLQIVFDTVGNLWAMADGGIASVALRNLNAFDAGALAHLSVSWYTQEDGYTESVANEQPVRSRDGRLFFTSPHALCTVDPAHLPINPQAPSVVIESATADARNLPLDRRAVAAPGRGALEVHFTALSFAAPERIRFRYKLEGHDTEWIDAGSRRAAYYTNLPPRSYTFRVAACNNDGIWNNQGASFSFALRPHFWQAAWFEFLMALLVIVVGAGLFWFRGARLNQRNHALEAKVADRTTALRAAYARLEALATIDGMTGLPNHRTFQERLASEIAQARRERGAVCVLLIDADYFKHYNDTYGHPAGDDVLREIGKLLRDNVRDGAFIARYGGEEFVGILSRTDLSVCQQVAERLRSNVETHAFAHRQVTISVGLAWHDFALPGGDDLVSIADKALYDAKRTGRNRLITAGEIASELSPRDSAVELAEAPHLSYNVLSQHFASVLDNPEALLQEPASQVLYELLSALDQGRWELPGHTVRSVQFALRLAQEVSHLEERHITPGDMQELALGGLLHDIGMTAIPLDFEKLAKLTKVERRQLQQHPERGAAMLQDLPRLSPALPVVLSHHECWDGNGYPHGLAGEEIPLSARIFAVANAVEAMSQERAYAAIQSDEAIRDEITRQAGKQFDPAIVTAYLKIAPEEWQLLRRAGKAAQPPSTDSLPHAA
jgi:diguanylate cyclase (GGDEF)-like protein